MSDQVIDRNAGYKKRQQYYAYQEASQFYDEKLQNYPTMPRYNHMMASIASEQGKKNEADYYYRQSLYNAPGDVMIKNDFAVHLIRNYKDRKEDAEKELKKALIHVNDNPLLHKNMAVVLGSKGDFRKALDHANQARFISPNDAQNHRNIARLHDVLGDSHTSLKHNLQAIEIEEKKLAALGGLDGIHSNNPRRNTIGNDFVPNTSAYRAAAVQIISKGGSHEEAYALINKARKYEKKQFVLPTTQRTYEIIDKIKARQGDQFKIIEEQRKAEEERKAKSKAEWEKLLRDITK
jgi:tetratricopeptide (TPR) repeat protein